MNKIEMATALTIAGGFDNRRVDDITVAAWMEVLGGYDLATVKQAILEHHRDPATRHAYLTVGHVLDRVERIKRLRSLDVEADVRSAKARGLVSKDWPDRDQLPADVMQRLVEAREADRVQAARYEIEAAS